jgi:pyridinium-3,5-biscarboxylic acid mononucleotide sulfurtransferase
MTEILAAKKQRAQRLLERHDRVIVALSGGVDSAVLLALAVETRGAADVVAATGVSPSLARVDLESARTIARRFGVRHFEVPTHEMRIPEYRANAGDRCYHCRSELFGVLTSLAAEIGGAAIAYGAIADDRRTDRPGMRAADERHVLAPLLEAGITKEDVRALARAVGLDVADKPAAACLASRLEAGEVVTVEALRQIERAEAGIRALGFHQVRVRHHGSVARLELDEAGLGRIWQASLRQLVCGVLRDAGFRFVTVDLEGYRPAGTLPLAHDPES